VNPEDVHYSGGQDALPLDRLTRLADVGRRAMEADPEWQEEDKVILSLVGKREDDSSGCGLFISGYMRDPADEEFAEVPDEKKERVARLATAGEVVGVLMNHAESLLAEVTGHPVKIVPVQPFPVMSGLS
jgi:hypothetical protein